MGIVLAKEAIILVHGVGPADEGSTIRALLAGSYNQRSNCEFSTLQLGQHSYTRGELDDGPDLFESNWSQFRPLQTSGAGILFEALVLVFGMLKVTSFKDYAKDNGSKWLLGRLYFVAFVTWMFWSIHLPIVSMFLLSESTFGAVLWIAILALVAFLLGRYDRLFYSGFCWCVLMLLMIGEFHLFDGINAPIVKYSVWNYLISQCLVMFLGLIAMGYYAFTFRLRTMRQTLVRMAFVYVPFLVASSVGSVVWVLALTLVKNLGSRSTAGFDKWASAYTSSMKYDLFYAEGYNGLLVFGCGLLLVLPAFVLIALSKIEDKQAAIKARLVFDKVLLALPVVLLLSIPGFVWFVYLGTKPSGYSGLQVWEAYSAWSIRILAMLPFLFGGMAFVLKASGDVLLYLCPQSELIRTRIAAREKLDKLVLSLKTKGYKVLLLCHSQGTIIGLDVALKSPGNLGIWISGSPSDSLYFDYLGLDRISELEIREFRNYYRYDDPIAGKVRDPKDDCINVSSGFGGHTNYWADFRISELKKAIQRV
ncbi:hypothetical protein N9M66_00400 [Litoreibacter sp.]|nr:hypothetical protein [Litoreibacter sp.]